MIAGAAGDHASAAELMQRSVASLRRMSMEFRCNLAKALMHEEKLVEAEEVLRRAVTRDPESPPLVGTVGRHHRPAGQV